MMKKIQTETFSARNTPCHDWKYYGSHLARELYGYQYNECTNFGNIRNNLNVLRDTTLKVVRFKVLYIAILMEIVIVIYCFIKKKTIWVDLGLMSILIGILLITVLGTCAEWGRTAICVLPFLGASYARVIMWGRTRVLMLNSVGDH